MRVASERPCSNGGWLHPLNGEFKKYVKRENEPEPPQINAMKLMDEFSADTNSVALAAFAESLGVTLESLQIIGCERAASYRAWAFPMYSSSGEMVGIRLRRDDGSKFAVTGSKSGIFMAAKEPEPTAYIVEGASDLSALISMGLYGFGRPQCSGCIATITATLSRLKIQRVVIITDSDTPGLNGANSLTNELDIPSLIWVPPAKDLRQAYRFGLTSTLLKSLTQSQTWTVPPKRNQLFVRGKHFTGSTENVSRILQ